MLDMDDRKRQRVRAVWRVQAAAAGLCVGACSYALCAGAGMPLCLNAAWLSSLAVWPGCVLVGAFARRRLLAGGAGRALCAGIAALMLLLAAFSYAALVSLIKETLLPLARISFIAQITAGFLLLCCLSGEKGAPRLCFALRVVLPALLLLLAAKAIARGDTAGIFPLLGAGADALLLAALCMLPASLAALPLCLWPKALEGMPAEIPPAGFFIRRLLAGAGTASALLFFLALCSTYEGIALQRSWGERMVILSSGAPREGIAGTLLTLLQAAALALCAVCALLGAWRAAQGIAAGRKQRE